MSLDLGTLVGYLEVDASKWDKGFDQAMATLRGFESRNVPAARAAGEKVGEAVGEGIGEGAADGVEGAAPELEKAGEKAGESVGHGLATKGAAAAAGAAVIVSAAFVEALDVGAANDKLAASLGVGDKRAVELGRVASDLYSNAWGDSIDQVNEAIGFVTRNIGGMRKASEEDLGAITSRVLDVATAFDQDLAMTTAAAGQMVRTGMAKDIREALDIITVGLQGPANKADDLLETYNEYSTQFRKLGLSGKDTILLLGQGLKGGARDADIAADAIKEFSIRTLENLEQTNAQGQVNMTALGAAFTNVLPKSKDMYDAQEDLAAGGKRARDTFDLMIDGLRNLKDPADRSKTAVALFGTQAEDLGDALYAMDLDKPTKELDKVAGASERMSNTLNDNARTKISTFTRTLKMNLVDFLGNEVIPAIEDFADDPAVQHVFDALVDASDDLKPLGKSILPAVGSALETIGGAVEKAAPFVKTVFDAFNSLPKEMQAALVLGGTAAALSKKFTGSANPLSALTGGALSKTAPIPVYVVNQGGPDGKDGLGGKAGYLALLARWGITGAVIGGGNAASNAANGDDVRNMTPQTAAGGGGMTLPGVDPLGLADDADKATDSMVRLNDAASKLPNQMDQGKTAAQSLFSEILKVDRSDPRVNYTAPGFDELLRKTRDYYLLLDDLDGDTIETFIKTTRLKNDTGDSSIQPPGRSGPATSGGGIFTSAQWAYVGDGGAEVVRPLADDLELRRQAAVGGGVAIDYDRLTQALLLARPVHGDVHISGDPTVFRREMLADERAANRSGRRRVGV